MACSSTARRAAGKTLLAREICGALGAREPKIVNGPEMMSKYVGDSEQFIRSLFVEAEIEQAEAGDASMLHVIVFDELDAFTRERGSLSGDTSGVRDSVVNQLLAKMDGVDQLENVLIIGLTNRPELIDAASCGGIPAAARHACVLAPARHHRGVLHFGRAASPLSERSESSQASRGCAPTKGMMALRTFYQVLLLCLLLAFPCAGALSQ